MRQFNAIIAVLALLQIGTSSQATVWDITADFSITNGNPNGAWSYGWAPVDFSSFNLYTNFGNVLWSNRPAWYGWVADKTPYVFKNTGDTGAGVPTGWISIHPGDGKQPSMARWTTPAGISGQAKVKGQFLPGNGGWMQVAIRKNNAEVWHAENEGVFDLVTNVNPGDTIDFTVYGGYESGDTPVAATIDLTPDTFTLTGTFTDPSIPSVQIAGQPINLIVKINGSVLVDTSTTLDSSAQFQINGLPAGTYDVYAKASHWLRVKVANIIVSGNKEINFSAVNGDADGDNLINLFDFVVLDSSFNTSATMADLDCDGKVNLMDYVIIDQGFGSIGAGL